MFTVEMIEQEHKKVKSGSDFPDYIRAIKRMGVTAYETWVLDGHTVYFGRDNFEISSGPKYNKLKISDQADKEMFSKYLKNISRDIQTILLFAVTALKQESKNGL